MKVADNKVHSRIFQANRSDNKMFMDIGDLKKKQE